MTEGEFLRRIDTHIELTREHIARGNVLMGRLEEKMDEVTEELRLCRESHADLRTFIRDITRRNELVWREMRDSIAALGADLRDQLQAQTAAILRVLDRLEPEQG